MNIYETALPMTVLEVPRRRTEDVFAPPPRSNILSIATSL